MRSFRDTRLFRATRFLLATLLVAGCVTRGPVVPTTVGPERIARMLQIAEAEWQRWGSPWVGRTADGAQCALLASGDCVEVDDGCGREMTAALCPVVNGYWASLGPGGIQRHTCPLTDQCEARWPPNGARRTGRRPGRRPSSARCCGAPASANRNSASASRMRTTSSRRATT